VHDSRRDGIKLHTYSHPKYRFCADVDLLKEAIENKQYPFDDGTEFTIRELETEDPILPECVRTGILV